MLLLIFVGLIVLFCFLVFSVNESPFYQQQKKVNKVYQKKKKVNKNKDILILININMSFWNY